MHAICFSNIFLLQKRVQLHVLRAAKKWLNWLPPSIPIGRSHVIGKRNREVRHRNRKHVILRNILCAWSQLTTTHFFLSWSLSISFSCLCVPIIGNSQIFNILFWAFDLNCRQRVIQLNSGFNFDSTEHWFQSSIGGFTLSSIWVELRANKNAKQCHIYRRCNTYRLHISTYRTSFTPGESVCLKPFESCNAIPFFWLSFCGCLFVRSNIVSFHFVMLWFRWRAHGFDCRLESFIVVIGLLLLLYLAFFASKRISKPQIPYELFLHHGQFSTGLEWTCLVKANGMGWGQNALFLRRLFQIGTKRVWRSAHNLARINRRFRWRYLGQYLSWHSKLIQISTFYHKLTTQNQNSIKKLIYKFSIELPHKLNLNKNWSNFCWCFKITISLEIPFHFIGIAMFEKGWHSKCNAIPFYLFNTFLPSISLQLQSNAIQCDAVFAMRSTVLLAFVFLLLILKLAAALPQKQNKCCGCILLNKHIAELCDYTITAMIVSVSNDIFVQLASTA